MEKTCQNCVNSFSIASQDLDFYKKMDVPSPTFCPLCRAGRRFAWRNERGLYKRKESISGEEVFSMFSEDAPFPVYKNDRWWSDEWDPLEYGQEYDFSRPFFEQFKELLDEVPFPSLYTEYTTMVNSDYCNAAATLRNCYLCFKADESENCAYLNTISGMKECFDCSFSNFCELCYESVTTNNSYRTFWSQNCEECQDVYFCEDCVGCSDCVGCIGLRKKRYHIFNRPYSKEEYEKELKEFDFGSLRNVQEFRKRAKEFAVTQPHKEFTGRKNTNSSGDYLFNCKNVQDSFMVGNGENLRYCQLLKAGPAAQAYDYTMFALKAEWIYECAWTGISVNNVKFAVWCYKCHDIEYAWGCHGAGNLFGCVGIRNGEYCILNKQYGKKDYEETVKKIKQQMLETPYEDMQGRRYLYGEFFPLELYPWAYNESTAQEWFSLTKEEALKQGFAWRDPDPREYREATSVVPDNIRDVGDEILKEILKCDECGKNYLIIKVELDFYRRFNLPVPRACPLCRDQARIHRLSPMALYDRTCTKCEKDIRTSYAPDREEIVYCEECYQREMI